MGCPRNEANPKQAAPKATLAARPPPKPPSQPTRRAPMQLEVALCEDLVDDLAFDVGEAKIAAGEAVGQAFVVHAQHVQERCV